MIGIGVIGLGGMGSFHTNILSKVRRCRVVAGTDVSVKARRAFAKQFSHIRIYTGLADLLANPEVNAVIVTTPTLLHKQFAIAALRAGKHVLCEKPMARTVADCRRMIEVAKRARRLLMVAHCRRFDREWGRFAQIIKSGTLGRPIIWRSISGSRGPGGWFMDDKLSGGPMMDGAVHSYDFANMLFGAATRVTANSIKLNQKVTCIDTATAVVEYPRGDQLLLSWSWANGVSKMSDIIGPKGGLIFGPGHISIPATDRNKYSYYCLSDHRGKDRLIRFRSDSTEMYRAQATHFIGCITGKVKRCLSPASEAIKAVAVAEAVLKAAPSGGRARSAGKCLFDRFARFGGVMLHYR